MCQLNLWNIIYLQNVPPDLPLKPNDCHAAERHKSFTYIRGNSTMLSDHYSGRGTERRSRKNIPPLTTHIKSLRIHQGWPADYPGNPWKHLGQRHKFVKLYSQTQFCYQHTESTINTLLGKKRIGIGIIRTMHSPSKTGVFSYSQPTYLILWLYVIIMGKQTHNYKINTTLPLYTTL